MRRSDMELDCKIVDVSLHSPPVVTKAGFRIVARFTFMRWPLRIRGCAIVRAPDDTWLIWTPDPTVKFSRGGEHAALPVVLEAIKHAAESAGQQLDAALEG